MFQALGRTLTLGIALLFAGVASAQEYFGTFLETVVHGSVDFRATPRPLFTLEKPLRFTDPNGLPWTTPAGTVVDGASIPQAFWSFIGGPFEGPYLGASVIHDHYCNTKERTAHDTHRNFYYGMRAAGVEAWRAKLMHWAVDTMGPTWQLQQTVVNKEQCTTGSDGATRCAMVPTVETTAVSLPGVDLDDPEVRAAALSKASAVAKTLRTSGGQILDVTAQGPVPATEAEMRRSAESYRALFASKAFLTAPARLGLLGNPALTRDVQPWAGNRIPVLANTRTLTPQTAPALRTDEPFRIDRPGRTPLLNQIDTQRAPSRRQNPVQ